MPRRTDCEVDAFQAYSVSVWLDFSTTILSALLPDGSLSNGRFAHTSTATNAIPTTERAAMSERIGYRSRLVTNPGTHSNARLASVSGSSAMDWRAAAA